QRSKALFGPSFGVKEDVLFSSLRIRANAQSCSYVARERDDSSVTYHAAAYRWLYTILQSHAWTERPPFSGALQGDLMREGQLLVGIESLHPFESGESGGSSRPGEVSLEQLQHLFG